MTEPTTEQLLESTIPEAHQCPNCQQHMERHLFPPGYTICIACALDSVYRILDPLEHFSNNNKPKGTPHKKECNRCKTMNWWSNLTMYPHPNGWGDQFFCRQCLSEQTVKDYYDEQERKIEEYQAKARTRAPAPVGPSILDDLDIEI